MIGPLTSRTWTGLYRFLGRTEKPAKRIAGIKAAHLETNQDLLDELRCLSNERLGFFPATARRAIEYPWFAERLLDCAGKRILDVGAGVNALPLWLADRGAAVVTVDSHPQVRDPLDKSHWNEWGYLDYRLLDPSMESHQVSIVDFQSRDFDYVYSVSVIEHMPRKVRVQAITSMARLLRADGVMLLSVDLIPKTDRLWNKSEGRIVDDPKVHGRLDDLQSEIKDAGLATTELEVIQDIEGSRTDIAFLVVRSPTVHSP